MCRFCYVDELGFFLNQGKHFWDSHTGYERMWNECYIRKCDSVFPQVEMNGEGFFLKEEGYQILVINGHPIAEITECVEKHFGADQSLESVYWSINMTLIFQQILMYMDIYPPYQVRIHVNGQDSLLNIGNGVDYWALKYDVVDGLNEFFDYDKPYSFEIYPDSSVAIIRFNVCVSDEGASDFECFLRSCFEQIKSRHISSLFIDISRNGGGNGNINYMFVPYLRVNKSLRMTFRWQEKVMTKKKEWRLKTIRTP